MRNCGKNKVANELENLLKLMNSNKNPEKIINFYKNTTELNRTWGSLLHYVALIKE